MGRGRDWTIQELHWLQGRLAAGWSKARIAQERGWSVSSVKKAAKRLEGAGGEPELFYNRHGPETLLSPECVEKIRHRLESQPQLSPRSLTKILQQEDHAASRSSVRRFLRRSRKPVKKFRGHAISEKNRAVRKEWCATMLSRLALHSHSRLLTKTSFPLDLENIVFSDEKFFRVAFKKHNEYVWIPNEKTKHEASSDNLEAFQSTTTQKQFTQGVMVGSVFSLKTGLGPPVFISSDVKMCSDNYQQLVQEQCIPWLVSHGLARDAIVWQQDNAPSHALKSTKAFLKSTFKHFLGWPAQSPDLPPLDYHVWNKYLTDMPEFTNFVGLRAQIHVIYGKIKTDASLVTCLRSGFQHRHRACLQQGGGHFKHLL